MHALFLSKLTFLSTESWWNNLWFKKHACFYYIFMLTQSHYSKMPAAVTVRRNISNFEDNLWISPKFSSMADDTCQLWYGSQSELPVVCLFHAEHYIECWAESTMHYFYIPVNHAALSPPVILIRHRSFSHSELLDVNLLYCEIAWDRWFLPAQTTLTIVTRTATAREAVYHEERINFKGIWKCPCGM